MPDKTIIFGDIIDGSSREKLKQKSGDLEKHLSWYQAPIDLKIDSGSLMVFVDLDDPRFSTPDFLVSLATSRADVTLVGKADNSSVNEAIKFSKLGISEILSGEQCFERLGRLLEEIETIPDEKPQSVERFGIEALIGSTPSIQNIKNQIALLADVDFPSAMILGKTGSGKGLIAKILHYTGVRRNHNLVEVNCSAIPDELFESELFGHVKGAFTDAKSDKMGLFEYAQNGTLFLDEVGNLSASAQSKLLKILEDKRLRKIGSVRETDVNVRVVVATNLNLDNAVREGRFREDLYYRLNLLTIEIPELKERLEDIPLLTNYYLEFYSKIYGKPGLKIEDQALSEMREYNWPGNIRELCNVIERAVLLTKGQTVKAKLVRAAFKNSRINLADRQMISINVPPQGVSLDSIEQQIVKQVLDMFSWNKTEAARFLQISRPRLRRILQDATPVQDRRKS